MYITVHSYNAQYHQPTFLDTTRGKPRKTIRRFVIDQIIIYKLLSVIGIPKYLRQFYNHACNKTTVQSTGRVKNNYSGVVDPDLMCTPSVGGGGQKIFFLSKQTAKTIFKLSRKRKPGYCVIKAATIPLICLSPKFEPTSSVVT